MSYDTTGDKCQCGRGYLGEDSDETKVKCLACFRRFDRWQHEAPPQASEPAENLDFELGPQVDHDPYYPPPRRTFVLDTPGLIAALGWLSLTTFILGLVAGIILRPK